MNIWILLLLVVLAACIFRMRRQDKKLAEQRKKLRKLDQQRGKLENVLQRRGRRLDVLFSAVNEAVMRVDRLGRVLAVNAQANRVFRPSPLIELPQSILVFYRNPEWHRSFIDALKGLPEASALPDIDVGEWVLASRLAPLGKDQALLLCVDITEQAKLEKQRRTFLSNLMHDLKTPLTSLLGYARSIQSFDDDADLRQEAAQVIADEAKHVNSLLDALLTLDQIEFGGSPADAHCDALQVISQLCDTRRSQFDSAFIELTVQLPSKPVTVAMAEDDFQRVLGNVLDNALRYTPDEGAVSVIVSENKNYCIIDLCDDGPGIPHQHLNRVTERFYRVDASRSRTQSGHGLGLAIVKETLLNYGGDVRFTNRHPQGLCVQLMIPPGE